MNYTPAKAIADHLVLNLKAYCERIEIAGSVRRLKADPKDIEIVVQPIIDEQPNMFGQIIEWHSRLEDVSFANYGLLLKNGPRYKQIGLNQGINLDLFIVLPPANWGVIFTIRTGPADFSRLCVTKRNKGGYLPSDCRVEDGRVLRGGIPVYDETGEVIHHWEGGEIIPVPEERDFLNFLGLGWIAPEDRR